MSDTPRTDAFCNKVAKDYKDDWNRWQLTANFAAELERELAAERSLTLDALRIAKESSEQLGFALERIEKLQRQLNESLKLGFEAVKIAKVYRTIQ